MGNRVLQLLYQALALARAQSSMHIVVTGCRPILRHFNTVFQSDCTFLMCIDCVMSAFLNQMVPVTDCTEDIILEYMIGGKIWWQLPASFSDKITIDSSGFCNTLTSPVIPTSDQDIMVVSFIYNGGPVNYTLCVQSKHHHSLCLASVYCVPIFFHCILGELTQPGNFSFHDVNATHIILSWNEPFSWVQPSDVVYVLTQNGSYTSKTVELRTHSFPLLRPPGGLYATLTPWNPVGEGESSTLNLTDSVLGCDKISMLNQRP